MEGTEEKEKPKVHLLIQGTMPKKKKHYCGHMECAWSNYTFMFHVEGESSITTTISCCGKQDPRKKIVRGDIALLMTKVADYVSNGHKLCVHEEVGEFTSCCSSTQ